MCLQVLCASWNRTKVMSLIGDEISAPSAAQRVASGAKDATIFDYCNNSRQPSNRDVIEALLLNPKV